MGLKDACIEKKTNHSLCATGKTVMLSAEVQEQTIKGIREYKSWKLCTYMNSLWFCSNKYCLTAPSSGCGS